MAALAWCKRNMERGDVIVKVLFYAEDVIAIPYNTDGKFRVRKMKVIEIVE